MMRPITVAGSVALAVLSALPVHAQRRDAPHAARLASPSMWLGHAPSAPAPRTADRGGFAQSGFAQFMASPPGRWLRVVAGAGMVAGGVVLRDDGSTTGGTLLATAGLIPLSAGAFDLCWISPLFGGPLRGDAIRRAGR